MRPRQFTDEELLAVARRCFLEHGPSVSTAVIAEQLGVSQAALFKRCGTKKALLLRALAPPSRPEWIDAVEDGPDDRPVPEQLREVLAGVDGFFKQMLPAISVLRSAGYDPAHLLREFDVPPPVLAHRTLTGFFMRLHEQGRAFVPRPKSTAMVFLGALHAYHMLHHMLGDGAPETEPNFLDNLVDTFWAGIAPRPETT